MVLNVIPFPRTKAPSTRAIFMWQLYVAISISPCRWLDKYLLLICVSNNFAQRRCPWKGKKQHGKSQKTCQMCWMRKCLGLGSTDDVEKLSHFMWRLVYRNNFFLAIFICHIKTNTPAFQQMQLSHKNWSFLIIYTGK